MNEIQQFESNLNHAIPMLQKDITKSPYEFTQKQKWASECEKKLKLINAELQQFQYYVMELPKDQSSRYITSLKGYTAKYNKLKEIFQEKKKKNNPNVGNLFQEREQPKPINELNTQDLISRGDETQKKIFDMLQSMDTTLEQGLALADVINLQLAKQIQQLDRMIDKVDDTASTLKRAEKQIGYFKKVMECDKCLVVLIFLILMAAIILIVMSLKKK